MNSCTKLKNEIFEKLLLKNYILLEDGRYQNKYNGSVLTKSEIVSIILKK